MSWILEVHYFPMYLWNQLRAKSWGSERAVQLGTAALWTLSRLKTVVAAHSWGAARKKEAAEPQLQEGACSLKLSGTLVKYDPDYLLSASTSLPEVGSLCLGGAVEVVTVIWKETWEPDWAGLFCRAAMPSASNLWKFALRGLQK